jgi:hypothetical protein
MKNAEWSIKLLAAAVPHAVGGWFHFSFRRPGCMVRGIALATAAWQENLRVTD